MTVQELLAVLNKCEPDSEVVCFVSWDSRVVKINSIEQRGANGSVVLSDALPKKTAQSHDGRD